MSKELEKSYDAIVVLGKNLGFGFGKDKIRKQKDYLAPHGRINADAAGMLYKKGRAKKIVLSTGVTVSGLPSEASLMKEHLHKIWPEIPDEDILLEEISKQTKGNAEEVTKLIKKENINPKNVGLVTMGFHMDRAQKFFRQQGLNPDPLPSEEIVGEKFPKFISKYKKKTIYVGEQIMEFGYKIIQSTPILKDIAQSRVESSRS